MSPIPDLLRTAIDLKKALDNAAVYLTPIGTCHSKATEWRQYHDEDKEDEKANDSDSFPEEVEIQAMEKLRKLQTDSTKTVESDVIEDLPFNLKISRTGCEYNGDISALAGSAADVGERLRQWYESGAVSGYGDVKAQETKVDPAVRDAREIPASEFSVAPELINRVQEIWGEASFFPTHVRAEPYKIHLYGPGGKFKAHRDTPETDLVGTFLLGLGDTSKTVEDAWYGAFEIKSNGTRWARHTAHLGSWVAFYPDVDHAVREIKTGHRAVIAFKIFRQHLETAEVPADEKLRGEIKDVLMQLQNPYGILLQHHYSAGTAELNGFDAALHAAADETGDVKLLPVLIRWTASLYEDYGYGGVGSKAKCNADVFPMTETHVDAVLTHIRAGGDEPSGSSKSKLFVDLKGTNAEWISSHSTESIPFYSPGFSGTSIAWREDIQDAIEHTGNESRPHEEDSIYLSYAVVVLPKRGTKRAAAEEIKRGDLDEE